MSTEVPKVAAASREDPVEEPERILYRPAILIDGAYLEHLIRETLGPSARVDHGKLLELLSEGRKSRVFYYDCAPWAPRKPGRKHLRRLARARKFYEGLREIPGLVVRLGHVESRRCGCCKKEHELAQKQTDVMLAIDLVQLSECGASRIVLLAGDSDFVPAVELARANGSEVHLYQGSGKRKAHAALKHACSKVSTIDPGLATRIARPIEKPAA